MPRISQQSAKNMNHQTILESIGLPFISAPGIALLGLVMIFALFYPGKDLIVFTVPDIPPPFRRTTAMLGGGLFVCGFIASLRLVPVYPVALWDCAAYSDQYKDGKWALYDPKADYKQRFWLGCRAQSDRTVSIQKVRTSYGVHNEVYRGYTNHVSSGTIELKKDAASEMISVFVNSCAPRLDKGSDAYFIIELADGTEIPAEKIRICEKCP